MSKMVIFYKKYHKPIIDVKFQKYLNIAESFNY